MNKIEFLKDQFIETRKFTQRLIDELPEDKWFVIPENTDSNFAWQIGHILAAQNFHTLIVICGRNSKIIESIPLDRYNKICYGMGSQHRSMPNNFVSAKKLKEDLDLVFNISIENLLTLSEDQLYDKLEPIPFKHPIADIKYEALAWSYKHEMWHCAEMEELKRLLGYPIKWLR